MGESITRAQCKYSDIYTRIFWGGGGGNRDPITPSSSHGMMSVSESHFNNALLSRPHHPSTSGENEQHSSGLLYMRQRPSSDAGLSSNVAGGSRRDTSPHTLVEGDFAAVPYGFAAFKPYPKHQNSGSENNQQRATGPCARGETPRNPGRRLFVQVEADRSTLFPKLSFLCCSANQLAAPGCRGSPKCQEQLGNS